MPTERFATAQATPERLEEIRRLCVAAFDGDFDAHDWEHALGGVHAIAVVDGAIVAHASVVPRVLEVGGVGGVGGARFHTGYVEAVATAAEHRRRGFGAAVMEVLAGEIRARYELGALAAAVPGFYERLGWERWRGPTYAGAVRTPESDDAIMVLRFGASAEIDLAAPIACEPRTGEDW